MYTYNICIVIVVTHIFTMSCISMFGRLYRVQDISFHTIRFNLPLLPENPIEKNTLKSDFFYYIHFGFVYFDVINKKR